MSAWDPLCGTRAGRTAGCGFRGPGNSALVLPGTDRPTSPTGQTCESWGVQLSKPTVGGPFCFVHLFAVLVSSGGGLVAVNARYPSVTMETPCWPPAEAVDWVPRAEVLY